jgi:hypothetical protein
MNDLEPFVQLAQALAPWGGQLVFVGGWAHRLHTLHPLASPQGHKPVFTRDTDLAFATAAPIEGDMKAALQASGFKEQLSGEFKPPVAHYTLGEQDKGFYAEFVTPLSGSGRTRKGVQDATLSKAGITAQKIRHLDILLVDPWVVSLTPGNAPIKAPLDVRVAHPLAFMVRKFLIQAHRPPKKRAQDILYVFDTIGLFGAQLDAFAQSWEVLIGPALGRKHRDDVLKLNEDTFSKVTDDVREAALIPQDRKISPEQIQATCQYAFERIFRL